MNFKRIVRCAVMLIALALANATVPSGCPAQAPPNLPPPGAYQPIPNFSGVGAGAQFRKAINDRFSGAQPVTPLIANVAFANLPSEQDGMLIFCTDCKRTSPCVASGTGAWALGTRGHWSCSPDSLEMSLSANGNRITNLAAATSNGDALGMGQATGGDLSGPLPSPIVQTVLSGKAPVYSGEVTPQFKQYAMPLFRAAGAIAAWGTATSQSVSKPAGVQSGDVEIAYIILQQTGEAFTPPGGWTQVASSLVSSAFFTTAEFVHVVGSSEPSSYSFSWSQGAYGDAYITDWYNVNTAAPIDSVATATPTNSGSSLISPAPTDSTTSDLNLIFSTEQCYPMTLGSPAGALVTSFSPGFSNWQESLWSYNSPAASATVNSTTAGCWKFGTQLALAAALSSAAPPILNGLSGASLISASLTSPTISGISVLTGSLAGSTSGSSISSNVNGTFNVQMYGAKGDGINADDVGIQAAIEAACAVAPAQVHFPRPAVFYKVTAPIFIDCNNIRLTGDTYQGTGNSGLRRGDFLTNIKSSFFGPIFVVKNGGAGIDLDTPLITGSTHSAKFDATTESYYLNLNDVPMGNGGTGPLSINGLSGVTIQAYFKLTNIADGVVVASAGKQYAGAGTTNTAYEIVIQGGSFRGIMTVNGVAASNIQDTVDTPTVGVLYHAALVLDPNGGASVLRFFVQGISRGTVAYGAAKTAVQQNWETAALGCGNHATNYTECQIDVFGPIRGSIDGVEIANIARYTAPFTPTYAEPVADSHTLVKASFDVNDRSLTQVQFAGTTNQWIPVRRITEPGGAGSASTTYVEMDHLSVSGAFGDVGIFAHSIIGCNFHDLSLGGMYEGINVWNTSFENRYDNIWVSAAGANGYYGIKDDGGIDYFGFGRVDGFPFQFVGRGGSYVLNNFFTQGEADTIWTYMFFGSGQSIDVCTGCESDQENSGTVYQGSFLLSGVSTVNLIGGSAVSSSTTTPAIQIAQVGMGSINGMGFVAIGGAPPEFIHVLAGNSGSPLQLINPNQFGGTRLWTDSPADVVVKQGDSTTGIIGSVVNGLQNVTPTVSACGTGASIAASGTSNAFVITVGSTNPTTSCAVSFGSNANFANPPVCTAQDITQGVALKQSSITSSGIALAAPAGVADMHGDTVNVVCIGK